MDDTGELLPLAEAADRLGLSAEALRKRIKRGTAEGHKDESGRWYVRVPDAPGAAPPLGAPNVTAYIVRLEREIERLHDENARLLSLSEALAMTAARALPPPPDDRTRPDALDERLDTGPIVSPPPEDVQDAPQGPSWVDRILGRQH